IHSWTWGDDRTTPINGAQSWTYDYFAPFTVNQVPPVVLPASPPGTYTITHTVVLNGVASTSTQQITLYQCCPANVVVPDGTLSSSIGGSLLITSVDVQGKFIINQNLTVMISQLRMEPGSEIIVKPGATLQLLSTTVTGCQGVMWKSITVENGGALSILNSQV